MTTRDWGVCVHEAAHAVSYLVTGTVEVTEGV
jgi:hypothetical protein